MTEGIGEQYHQETKYRRGHLPRGYLRWNKKPPPYKQYPDTPRIPLPEPENHGGPPIWEILKSRRSRRNFAQKPISLDSLSQIIWACQGITRQLAGTGLRTAPSAGALYPVETYLAVNHVSELAQGIYHYPVHRHALERLKEGDYRKQISKAALDQKMCGEAAAVFIWTGIFERSMWKYRQRAFRYIYLDAGHIAQNLALAAQALGLGSCQIAALYDEEVNQILGVDGQAESVLYMSALGHPI